MADATLRGIENSSAPEGWRYGKRNFANATLDHSRPFLFEVQTAFGKTAALRGTENFDSTGRVPKADFALAVALSTLASRIRFYCVKAPLLQKRE